MTDVSAVILTLNEGDFLRDCLESIVDLVDEIIIVDSGSEDDTVEIASEYADTILHETTERGEGFDILRQYGIDAANNKYILDIDADERVPSPLADRLREIVESERYDVVDIPRKNCFFGKWAKGAGWWPAYNPKLYNKECVEITNELHNFIDVVPDARRGKIPDEEQYCLVHINYRTIEDMIDSMNRYSTIEAKERDFSTKMVLWDPIFEFTVRFVYQGGWRLGYFGLILCLLRLYYNLILGMKCFARHRGWYDTSSRNG
ncbi:glycosyltransferase family 2 protein [Halapricum salinum]|uniref:Glycosyltransferase family 2 protein n=1 Tax=Halapricum salinum TaxID=1457250 RepID=A0A4D6HD49_9EURY|nr:glycosyltransferase family 2 protein [Halapricum salinum]QCC51730.1 glycosyltransferase family 2 protein [Halapricum salinum]